MRLEDSTKTVKIRIAKCKKQAEFLVTKKYEWEDVPPEHVKI